MVVPSGVNKWNFCHVGNGSNMFRGSWGLGPKNSGHTLLQKIACFSLSCDTEIKKGKKLVNFIVLGWDCIFVSLEFSGLLSHDDLTEKSTN